MASQLMSQYFNRDSSLATLSLHDGGRIDYHALFTHTFLPVSDHCWHSQTVIPKSKSLQRTPKSSWYGLLPELMHLLWDMLAFNANYLRLFHTLAFQLLGACNKLKETRHFNLKQPSAFHKTVDSSEHCSLSCPSNRVPLLPFFVLYSSILF
jgi:hypothetical protein